MKKKELIFGMLGVVLISLAGCSTENSETPDVQGGIANFTITIENVVSPKPIFQSGVFNTPVGASSPAPLFPGDVYEFFIDAGPLVLPGDGGTRLSFVTMFVQSNDLFFAPGEEGIPLYRTTGEPIGNSGPEDVTSQVFLWDAGTEINEETGGPNQKPQQEAIAEDQGLDENGVVTKIVGNTDSYGNILPETQEVIKVTVENTGAARFKVRIENVSDAMTIGTPGLGAGTSAPVPVSPGVYAVHTAHSPFFIAGQATANAGLADSVEGVENIAEDGFPEALLTDTSAATGLIIPLSPGAWAIHELSEGPIYLLDTPDFGEGLEAVAEDGSPEMLTASLATKTGVKFSGNFIKAVGADGPGAIGPGGAYRFTCTGEEGDYLSLATMFVQSNDWFYAFPSGGIPLFENGQPLSGEVSANVSLYDAGTEADEYPGAGLFQVIRQAGPDSGEVDPNPNVRLANPSAEQNVPAADQVIRIMITSEPVN